MKRRLYMCNRNQVMFVHAAHLDADARRPIQRLGVDAVIGDPRRDDFNSFPLDALANTAVEWMANFAFCQKSETMPLSDRPSDRLTDRSSEHSITLRPSSARPSVFPLARPSTSRPTVRPTVFGTSDVAPTVRPTVRMCARQSARPPVRPTVRPTVCAHLVLPPARPCVRPTACPIARS